MEEISIQLLEQVARLSEGGGPTTEVAQLHCSSHRQAFFAFLVQVKVDVRVMGARMTTLTFVPKPLKSHLSFVLLGDTRGQTSLACKDSCLLGGCHCHHTC